MSPLEEPDLGALDPQDWQIPTQLLLTAGAQEITVIMRKTRRGAWLLGNALEA